MEAWLCPFGYLQGGKEKAKDNVSRTWHQILPRALEHLSKGSQNSVTRVSCVTLSKFCLSLPMTGIFTKGDTEADSHTGRNHVQRKADR